MLLPTLPLKSIPVAVAGDPNLEIRYNGCSVGTDCYDTQTTCDIYLGMFPNVCQ